jgi:hypothetical protein
MFLRAAGRRTSRAIMDMHVRRAIGNGVSYRHVTLKPLVQIPGLSHIYGNPTAVLGLPGIDVVPGHRPEGSLDGMYLVWILLAGLPRPTGEPGILLSLSVTTKYSS